MPGSLARSPAMISRRKFLYITAAAGAYALAGCTRAPAGADTTGVTRREVRTLMGTQIHLTIAGADDEEADRAIAATFAAMTHLITCFDHRQPESAVTRLNRHGVLENAPRELLQMLQHAVAYGELTAGAFDVTMKPLLDARRAGTAPTAEAQALVDYRQIEITDRQIRLAIPGAAVTLDGIAKGGVIDGAVETLSSLGFKHVLVEAGGDLRTLGGRTDGAPWRVGIAHPRPAAQGDVLAMLPITAQAVATSGDYLYNFTTDHTEHHIIDPRSGHSPVELASATVMAPTALDADALGTALMILGSTAGLALAERLPAVEAVLVTKKLQMLSTSGVRLG